jgi:nucleotide-binding universal stress UspA family protein
MYRSILVPVDGSDCSEEAARHAVRLARATNANVTFLFVLRPMNDHVAARSHGYMLYVHDLEEERLQAARKVLEALCDTTRDAGVPAQRRLIKSPRVSERILEEAREHELVVMGSHGRTGLSRLVLGSVTESVTRASPIPVLVIRCQDAPSLPDEQTIEAASTP